VFDDGNDFILGQSGVEKDRAAMFGKALFAHFALQEPGVVSTIGVFNSDIFSVANAEGGAFFIRAAKLFQVVHDKSYRYKAPRKKELGGKSEK